MLTRPLAEADLPRAAALSARVGWNQVGADWRHFLRDGTARGLDDGDPDCLAATAAVLPYGATVAWISMVLVRPDRRREGLATALMRWAMQALAELPCMALDATPAGREVYRRLGFEDVFGFARWSLPGPLPAPLPGASAVPLRPIAAEDWPALLALDAEAFGAPRATLLRDFAARLPQAAFRTADGSGFVLARDGLRTPQIGPVIAADAASAAALIAAARNALPGPAVIDLADAASGLADWIAGAGGERQRPFTRMLHGGGRFGQPARNFAFAGPEFG